MACWQWPGSYPSLTVWCCSSSLTLPLPPVSVCMLVVQIFADVRMSLILDGFAFSQEEHGVVSQSEVIRAYNTSLRKRKEA